MTPCSQFFSSVITLFNSRFSIWFLFSFLSLTYFPSCQDSPCGVGPVEVGVRVGVLGAPFGCYPPHGRFFHGTWRGHRTCCLSPAAMLPHPPEPVETGVVASPCPTPGRLCPNLENHGRCCPPESPQVLWNEYFFQWLLCRFWPMPWTMLPWGRGSAELLSFDY